MLRMMLKFSFTSRGERPSDGSSMRRSFGAHMRPRPIDTTSAPHDMTLYQARDQFERALILRTLSAQQGNMSRTAEVLGVERSNLYRKMKAFGIAPARRLDAEEEAAQET